jgi:hypothetical protein
MSSSNVVPIDIRRIRDARPSDIIDTSGKTMAELKASVVMDAKVKIHCEVKRIAELASIHEAITHLENEIRHLADRIQP